MLVVVTDESVKNARIKSRRILSKFLPQIGAATWMGNLSTEGLLELQKELKKNSSKNMATCCFLVRSSKRYEVAWFVGSKSNWNENGWFVFQTKALEQKVIPPPANIPIGDIRGDSHLTSSS